MTFLEAYETYGRDSMAIAKACNMTEAEAYNLMASRADSDRGIYPKATTRKDRERAYNAHIRAELNELRRAAGRV